MQCILYKIYFWKVFHMYYNLICTPIWTKKFYSCKKWVLHFRSHHVPLRVMKLKKKEFEDLNQDSMSVSEYVTRFTQLSCYALDNVDTNEKKQDWFLNGLNDGFAYALEARDFVNFQDKVDKAFVLENR
jgi:hypothetical protein